jgi:hypothetical protein
MIMFFFYLGYTFPDRNESDAMFSALKVTKYYLSSKLLNS